MRKETEWGREGRADCAHSVGNTTSMINKIRQQEDEEKKTPIVKITALYKEARWTKFNQMSSEGV